jgi:hypothetical protein
MNIRIFISFVFLASIIIGFSSATIGPSGVTKIPASTKDLRRPILFYNYNKLCCGIKEFCQNIPDATKRYEAFVEILNKKASIAFATIAKQLGACAVLLESQFGYIDPLFDITQEAVDILKLEYIKLNPAK